MVGRGMKRTGALVGCAVLALGAVIFATGCGGSEAHPTSSEGVVILTATPPPGTSLPRRTAPPTPPPTPSPLEVCASNPDPASPKALQVQEPQPQQQVKIPFHLRGWGSNIGHNKRGGAPRPWEAKQSIVQVLEPQPRTWKGIFT